MDHRYMRPPPPLPPQMPEAASDSYQRPPPPFPPPSNQPWTYSTPQQFQYHPQPQHSPSPPPPPQWVVPPPSSDHSQYPPPPLQPPPYAHQAPPYPGNHHYLLPRPPQVPQSHAQDWGSGSWSQHQSWQYPNNSNEEDWAAKARAWAAAKSVTDNQQPQSQFVSAARPEGQHHFPGQFSQPVGPQFSELHRPLTQASSYEQYPLETEPPNGSGLGHSQEVHYSSSGQSSYAAEIHASYAAKDESLAGNSVAPFSQHDKSSQSPSVHQQEVPSSYSTLAGYDPGNRYEEFNSSSSQSVSQHHFQPLVSASGRSGWMEEPNHLLGSQPAESLAGVSDQPLNFAPHFNRNLDPHAQPNYSHSSGGPVRAVDPVALSSNYAWPTSSAPGAFYPPAATKMASGPQVDHPAAMPPASGHPTTMFPTGPGFQPNVPMTGHTFGIVSGLTPHHVAFSGDAYGVSSMSERPKKASVPNWLREEIIKNKAVITSSTAELSKEETQSVDEDFNGKFFKRDQADSRSIDSSRSTEDEDEEEVEAARTAAINQEIKRILTEVLLKVTDELFDEIATRVLNEDDLSVEVSNDIDLSNDQVLPSTQATLTPKASAKILIPKKAQKVNVDDASENSISSAGDVLGLGSYGSDEEDEVIQNSGKLKSKESSKHLRSSSSKDLEDHHVSQNGSTRKLTEEQNNDPAKLKADVTGSKSPVIKSPVITTANISVVNAELSNTGKARELASGDNELSLKRPLHITEEESQRGSDSSKSNKSVTEKAAERNERPGGSLDTIRSGNDCFRTSNIKNRPDKNDEHENQKSSSLKKDTRSVSVKERPGVKVDEKGRRQEERHTRAEKTDYHNGLKDKRKVKGRTDEKTKDSESRKQQSPGDANEGASRSGREKMHSDKEDAGDRRRDKTRDEKKERSRHDTVGDSGRNKRHRTPSVDNKGRESKNNSVSHANNYSDQSSDDSKRRLRQPRRHKSPSPIRQRKRQVSRSPHSKHSNRRHSPSYSSLETTRGKRSPPSRSRSRSPVHRRR